MPLLLSEPQSRDFKELKSLPAETGVYRIYDCQQRLIYVGKSIDIRARILGHFRQRHSEPKEEKLYLRCSTIDWTLTGSELVALLMESEEIKVSQPILNRAQKRTRGFWAITVRNSPEEFLYLRAEPLGVDNQDVALWTFGSRGAAVDFARNFFKEHKLCEKLFVAQPKGVLRIKPLRPCFLHQIDCCAGACVGTELPAAFNARLKASLPTPRRFQGTFAVLDRGRHPRERAFVLVENAVYRGFGYVSSQSMKNLSLEKLLQKLVPRKDTRDARRILAGHLLKASAEIVTLRATDRATFLSAQK